MGVLQPLSVLVATAGTAAPFAAARTGSVAHDPDQVALTGTLFFAGWGIYAVLYGFVVGPVFFGGLIRDLRSVEMPGSGEKGSHQAPLSPPPPPPGQGTDSSASNRGAAPPAPARALDLARLGLKIKVLMGACVLLGGGQSVILFAFAAVSRLQIVGASYFIPIMIICDVTLLATAVWVMNNATRMAGITSPSGVGALRSPRLLAWLLRSPRASPHGTTSPFHTATTSARLAGPAIAVSPTTAPSSLDVGVRSGGGGTVGTGGNEGTTGSFSHTVGGGGGGPGGSTME